MLERTGKIEEQITILNDKLGITKKNNKMITTIDKEKESLEENIYKLKNHPCIVNEIVQELLELKIDNLKLLERINILEADLRRKKDKKNQPPKTIQEKTIVISAKEIERKKDIDKLTDKLLPKEHRVFRQGFEAYKEKLEKSLPSKNNTVQ